jgi:rod shape determining protein RodA
MPYVMDRPTISQRIAPIFRGFDGLLGLALVFLVSAGLLTMYSVGFDHGTRFMDHARNMLIAAFIMFVVAQIPPQQLMHLAAPIYVVGVVLLIGVELFGITRKGSTRWINVGVVIQPSEILKIGLPLMLAWWFQRREGQLRSSDFVVAMVLVAIPVGLIMKQPDLGTSLLVAAAGLAVIFFAGLSWKLVAPPLIGAAIGICLIVIFGDTWCEPGRDWPLLHGYQQQRVCTLLDPWKDPLGKGFHVIQGMIAIGAGGTFGKGFMQGTQTHLEFIPERTTDFIFAAYSEEFGLIGTLGLIVGFFFLIVRGFAIALDGPTLFSRLVAAAVTCIFFCYAFVNMGMVSGILPVVGVPLPFISYGGTAMVTLGLALGILMSVSRAKRLHQS